MALREQCCHGDQRVMVATYFGLFIAAFSRSSISAREVRTDTGHCRIMSIARAAIRL